MIFRVFCSDASGSSSAPTWRANSRKRSYCADRQPRAPHKASHNGDPATNILMDVSEKYPGYTHVALYVASIPATITALKANEIAITQGPVKFGEDGGVSVFVRDPDRNVIELRGPDQPEIEGVTRYVP
jgi:catechol 2,3-dioxygenase-like lactoylglutathione lyase family enzyme